jgi:uncharacterized NAD-dependent epimerase/dehydratase family protein
MYDSKAVVYAPCALGTDLGKTANDLVIYDGMKFQIVGVVDPCNSGRDAGEVVGVGDRGISVLGSIEEAISKDADALIIGVAPVGGRLPKEWIYDIIKALRRGLDVYSGMHTFLSDIPEVKKAAKDGGATIHDLRKPDPQKYRIWSGKILGTECKRVLVAGTDCGVGKNIVTIELYKELRKNGVKATFVGTGQTMLLLGAKGVVIDAYPADFTPGVIEETVYEACSEGNDVVVVEGQGALLHPAYGQVSLAILYGTAPTHIVLAHEPYRKHRVEFPNIPLPPIKSEVEEILRLNPNKPSSLAGICIDTHRTPEEKSRYARKELEDEFGVPVKDPLKDSVTMIVENILK